jgi:hypothetical protein
MFFCVQVLAEDWETPKKSLEILEAISNYFAVWRGLWLNDPSPFVLFKLRVAVNCTVSRASCIWQNENGSCEAGPNSRCW